MLRISTLIVAVAAFSCGVSESEVVAQGDGTDTTGQEVRRDPCATVRCAAGTHCERRGQRASCVPDEPVLTCASVLCIVGTVCEETPSGPRCVAQPSECSSDSDCRLEDNYCGGCNCLALATNESGPTCSEPVQCFAAPCQVTSDTAACVDGQCVRQSSGTL